MKKVCVFGPGVELCFCLSFRFLVECFVKKSSRCLPFINPRFFGLSMDAAFARRNLAGKIAIFSAKFYMQKVVFVCAKYFSVLPRASKNKGNQNFYDGNVNGVEMFHNDFFHTKTKKEIKSFLWQQYFVEHIV